MKMLSTILNKLNDMIKILLMCRVEPYYPKLSDAFEGPTTEKLKAYACVRKSCGG